MVNFTHVGAAASCVPVLVFPSVILSCHTATVSGSATAGESCLVVSQKESADGAPRKSEGQRPRHVGLWVAFEQTQQIRG